MVLKTLIKIIVNMVSFVFRRGKGLFKILFVIDDFFRLFTMTIIIPVFFRYLGFGDILITLGLILGFIIDVQDFIAEAGIAKITQ